MNIGFSGALPLFALKPNIGTDIKFATRAVTISTIYIAIIGVYQGCVAEAMIIIIYIGITRFDVKVGLLLRSYKQSHYIWRRVVGFC